jgi:hypothetical protein
MHARGGLAALSEAAPSISETLSVQANSIFRNLHRESAYSKDWPTISNYKIL